MSKLIKKALSLPTYIYVVFGVGFVLNMLMYSQGTLTLTNALVIFALMLIVTVSYVMGKVIIYGLVSFLSLMYMNSLAVVLIGAFQPDFFVQPFLITLAAYLFVLSFSYSTKAETMNRNLRNRWLWSFLIVMIYIIVKVFLIADLKFPYWVSEGISLSILGLLVILFLTWIAKAKKTKINKPAIFTIDENDDELNIRIDDRLDKVKSGKGYDYRWGSSGLNAYPWLFSYALYAHDNKKDFTIYVKKHHELNEINVSQIGSNKIMNITIKGDK